MASAHKCNPDDSKATLIARAKNVYSNIRPSKRQNHNLTSILFRLTGQRLDRLLETNQIMKAKAALEKALLVERRKAKMKRFDYDLNRHIALHQANKELSDIQNQNSEGLCQNLRKIKQ